MSDPIWQHTHGEWCGPKGRHLLVTIYSRPWRRFFRKTYEIRCWECDVKIVEPDLLKTINT